MSDYMSPRFEDQIRAAMAVPLAHANFVESLAQNLSHAGIKPRRNRSRVWRPLRAISIALLILLLSAILIIGPQRVLAQVLDWLGYVPGVGFVDQEGGLRVLESPVSQTRDGITVTIEDGLIDAERTRLTFFFEGIRQELKPLSEDEPGCGGTPSLLLPDGRIYPILEGEGTGGVTWMRQEFRYGALPLEMSEIKVLVPCIPDVRPGAGPEDWEFTIRFVPAPENFEVLPILPLPTVTTVNSNTIPPHGMQLSVDELVELEDGYLFRGQFTWDPDEYEDPVFWNFQLRFNDAAGNTIPVEVEYDQNYGGGLGPFFTWTAQTNTQDIKNPATFVVEDMSVRVLNQFNEENSFVLDLGDNPQPGQVWQINKVLHLGGGDIIVNEVVFESQADGTYGLLANLTRDPAQIPSLELLDQDNRYPIWSSSADYQDGNWLLGIGYHYLPVGIHHFWVDNYFVSLAGPWTATVELPEPSSSAEPIEPEVCLTQQSWQAALSNEQPRLSLEGRVLQEDRSVPALLPNLLLVPLDGSPTITIGQGSWAALSPDGQRVAYAYEGLRVIDVASGQTSLLIAEDSSYAMSWSPDGKRIALIRGGDGVYTINADGSQLQRVPGSSADMIGIAGWLLDGQHIAVSRISSGGTLMQTLNVSTGQTEDLFVIDNLKGGFAHLSPDRTRILFSAGVFGKSNYGTYVANLDGSNQQLVAEPGDEFIFTNGAWSPDGQSLILNPYPDIVSYHPEPQHPVLVNLHSCQISILDQLLGVVTAWGP